MTSENERNILRQETPQPPEAQGLVWLAGSRQEFQL